MGGLSCLRLDLALTKSRKLHPYFRDDIENSVETRDNKQDETRTKIERDLGSWQAASPHPEKRAERVVSLDCVGYVERYLRAWRMVLRTHLRRSMRSVARRRALPVFRHERGSVQHVLPKFMDSCKSSALALCPDPLARGWKLWRGGFQGDRKLSLRIRNRGLGGTHPDHPLKGLEVVEGDCHRVLSKPDIPGADWSGYDHGGYPIFTCEGRLFRRLPHGDCELANFVDMEPNPQAAPAWAKVPLPSLEINRSGKEKHQILSRADRKRGWIRR